ncbi:MAG: hypothetical protein V3U86_11160, partial [Acidobacteriota bacterium]
TKTTHGNHTRPIQRRMRGWSFYDSTSRRGNVENRGTLRASDWIDARDNERRDLRKPGLRQNLWVILRSEDIAHSIWARVRAVSFLPASPPSWERWRAPADLTARLLA